MSFYNSIIYYPHVWDWGYFTVMVNAVFFVGFDSGLVLMLYITIRSFQKEIQRTKERQKLKEEIKKELEMEKREEKA